MFKKMRFLLSFLFLFMSASSFASTINCSVNQIDGRGSDYSAVFVDIVRGTCERGTYAFQLSGIGLGLRWVMGSAMGITCPFSDEIVGTYGGVKADATVLIGAQAGLFVGSNGICALGGVTGLGAGVNLSGSRLKIVRIKNGD